MIGSVVIVLLLTAVPGRAHYIELNRELAQRGVFSVGISATGSPFAQQQDGVFTGFEVAMAQGVADAHDLSLRLVRLPRDELAAALRRGEVDAVNTLALSEDIPDALTVPYLIVGDHVMILRGNPFRIERLDDLQGRTVAATSGSTAERFALSLNERFQSSGGSPMQVHSFPFHRATHFPVSMGHAAAYFVKTVSAVAISRDPDARVRMLEGAFRAVREVGFTVRAGDDNIYHAIEHALAAMVATGKYERLRQSYGLPAELSPFR
ncbi:MAG TPA: transporter substrate-binding domain-containing protein [Gammaproteobacteria bacterium]|nr:transporter substrate-binding domain-containing protein [Gammaproteobacteria bacterium]